jgi:hypothetical protein
VALGQPGLELEHPARGRPGVGFVDKPQHRRDVLDVVVSQVGVLVLAVVRLVGESEAALHQLDDVAGGVFAVVADVPLDQPGGAMALQPAEQVQQLPRRRDAADVGQVGGQRLGVQLLGPVGVHERCVEVPHLLLVGARAGAGRGSLLQDVPDVDLRLVAQLVERPVGGAVGWDLHLRQPAGVDVTEQVVLRAYVFRQLVDRDPTGLPVGLRHAFSSGPGCCTARSRCAAPTLVSP